MIKVLLADDHAIVRAGIRKVVEDIPGLQVVAEVGDGPQVFAALERALVDCLLIDVTMPEFEPVTAIRQIRVRFPDVKILVVSAYDDDVYVQGMFSAGVNGYHLKDQPLSDLKLAVQRVLNGEHWVSGPLISKLLGANSSGSASSSLTERQRDLLRLLQQGLDNHSIAQQMGLSVKTVENHLTRLYRQLNVQSRLEAVNFLMRHPQVLGLPESPAVTPAIEQMQPTEEGLPGSISILVVDDNSRYRLQIQRMIGKVCPSATIHEARNIQTALALAQSIGPQLALIDVVLGDEDGILCARRLKSISPHSRIVLISAYPDREFHRLGLQAGAVAFLDKKDLNLPVLRQVIEDIMP